MALHHLANDGRRQEPRFLLQDLQLASQHRGQHSNRQSRFRFTVVVTQAMDTHVHLIEIEPKTFVDLQSIQLLTDDQRLQLKVRTKETMPLPSMAGSQNQGIASRKIARHQGTSEIKTFLALLGMDEW